MSEKVVVRFLKAWRGYSADELAGFDEAVADGLKSKGFAEAYEGGGDPTPKAKAPKKKAGKAGDKLPATPTSGGNDGGDNDNDNENENENENEEKP